MINGASPTTPSTGKGAPRRAHPLTRSAIIALGLCLLTLVSLICAFNVVSTEKQAAVVGKDSVGSAGWESAPAAPGTRQPFDNCAIAIVPKERGTMKAAHQAGTQPAKIIPPIDTSAPGHIETATFALG